jgi:hypothetical protein
MFAPNARHHPRPCATYIRIVLKRRQVHAVARPQYPDLNPLWIQRWPKLMLQSLLQVPRLRSIGGCNKAERAALSYVFTAGYLRLARMMTTLLPDELDTSQKEILREHVDDLAACMITKAPA